MSDKVKIKITPCSQGSEVEINGVILKNVRAVSISAEVDQVSEVRLLLIGTEIEIEGESNVIEESYKPD